MAMPPDSERPESPQGSQGPGGPEGPRSPEGGDFWQLIQRNKWDSCAYFFIFVGIIISIFEWFVGELIIGTVFGIYFSEWMKERFQLFKEFVENEGVFRAFIMVIFPIVLLVVAPGIFLGLLLGCALRPILGDFVSSPFE